MSRHRWTLTLIIICLPILATVITAFRIRDLPKASHDSAKKEHCDDCEVKVGHKFNSVRIESDKRSNVETKKETRGKPDPVSKKPLEPHIVHKYEIKSEEDDDDDLDILKPITSFKREPVKSSTPGVKIKSAEKSSWSFFGDTDDDEYDSGDEDNVSDDEDEEESIDDDDDDDDNEVIKRHPITPKAHKPANVDLKKKADPPKLSPILTKDIKHKQITKQSIDSDEDDDDDDNDDDEEGSSKIVKPKVIQSKNEDKNKITKNDKIFQKPQSNEKVDLKREIGEKHKIVIAKDKPDLKPLEIEKKDEKRKGETAEFSPKSNKQHFTNEANLQSKESLKKDKAQSVFDLRHSDIQKKSDFKENVKIDTKQKEPKKVGSKKEPPPKTETLKHDNVVRKDSAETEIHTKKVPEKDKTPKTIIVSSEESEEEQTFSFWLPFTSLLSDSEDEDIIELTTPKLNKDEKKVPEIDSKPKTMPVPKTPEKQEPKPEVKPELKAKPVDKAVVKEKLVEKEKPKIITHDSKEEKKKEAKPIIVTEKPLAPTKPKPVEKESVKISKEQHGESKTDNGKKTKQEPKKQENSDDYKLLESMKELKVDGSKRYIEKQKAKSSKESTEKLVDSKEAISSSHLKQMNEALHRKNLLKSEFDDFYTFLPTFAPNFSRIHNPECRRHGQIVLRQLRGTKLWALNMLDATAKIPSGILQGNGIQLGDFDQCLSSRARVQLDTGSVVRVQGKYCLVHLDVKAEHPELEAPVHLAQAKNLIRSRIDDPGHFVPRFSTLSWGVCVPTACEPGDVELVVRDAIRHYQKTSGFAVRVKVDEEDCHTEDSAEWWENWLEWPVLATLGFYGVVLLLVVVATTQDFLASRQTDEDVCQVDEKKDKKETKDGVFSAFSLYYTLRKLTAPGTTDQIPCIHGVRAIATIALLIAHKFFPVGNMPYINRLKIAETVSSPIWSWCRAGWVFTDCFLLLSGALTAHRMSTDTETAAPKRLLSRYLRLTPALLAIVLFYAYIWDNISSGPMWGTFVTKNAEVCQEGWWWNLLYVQNFFGLENMCAPQTHQLALDMQLTILGGIIIWATQVKKGLSLILLPVLHGLAAYARYSTVRDHRLTLLAYHGVSVSQLYRTARLSYTSALHRSTPYLVGLTLGLALTKPTRHGKVILALGWLSSGMLWAMVWWAGVDAGSLNYKYNVSFAAQYAGLAPIASAMAIAWLIYAVNNGNCSFLAQFLSCRPLAIVSRLSYALYLCQFIIFMTNLGTVRHSSEFTLMSLIDVQEIAAVILLSTILTLTLVIPLQSVNKLLKFSFKFDTKEQNGPTTEKNDTNSKALNSKLKEERDILKPRAHFLAHREVLEEIPEVEVEYEPHRHNHEHLDEILEEEENEDSGEENHDQRHFDEELEAIEEEGGEDSWIEREYDERPYSREDDGLDGWEWTANNEEGAQYDRNGR